MFFTIKSTIPLTGAQMEVYPNPEDSGATWVIALSTPDKSFSTHNLVDPGKLPEIMTPSGSILAIIPGVEEDTWAVRFASYDGAVERNWNYPGSTSLLTVFRNIFQFSLIVKYVPDIRAMLQTLQQSMPET